MNQGRHSFTFLLMYYKGKHNSLLSHGWKEERFHFPFLLNTLHSVLWSIPGITKDSIFHPWYPCGLQRSIQPIIMHEGFSPWTRISSPPMKTSLSRGAYKESEPAWPLFWLWLKGITMPSPLAPRARITPAPWIHLSPSSHQWHCVWLLQSQSHPKLSRK